MRNQLSALEAPERRPPGRPPRTLPGPAPAVAASGVTGSMDCWPGFPHGHDITLLPLSLAAGQAAGPGCTMGAAPAGVTHTHCRSVVGQSETEANRLYLHRRKVVIGRRRTADWRPPTPAAPSSVVGPLRGGSDVNPG